MENKDHIAVFVSSFFRRSFSMPIYLRVNYTQKELTNTAMWSFPTIFLCDYHFPISKINGSLCFEINGHWIAIIVF